jgi:hypothetical protein
MSADEQRRLAAAAPEHPAPHRHRVSAWAMAIGVLAAPLTWSLQLLVDVAITGHHCGANHLSPAVDRLSGVQAVLLIVNGMAIVLCAAAGTIAWRNWNATRDERPGRAHHLVESGDGRTRFLAMTGLMTSTLFAAAIVFESINLFVVPACR